MKGNDYDLRRRQLSFMRNEIDDVFFGAFTYKLCRRRCCRFDAHFVFITHHTSSYEQLLVLRQVQF